MAPRAFWTGWLKLSLVTCRVTMVPATTDREKVRFHTLNRATGNRIVTRYIDEGTGKPVKEDDEARGYQAGEDNYVLVEDEELDAIALDSVRTIDIETFVPADSVSWTYLDKPHYLAPGDEVGTEAFAVIRDAMEESGMVALSRLVLYRREHGVMLEPRGRGFVLWTLRYGDEVRDFEGDKPAEKPEGAAMTAVRKLIKARTRPWSPDLVEDPVQEGLLKLIAAESKKRPQRKRKAETEDEAPRGNVVNIMDALRRSLSEEGKGTAKGGKSGRSK